MICGRRLLVIGLIFMGAGSSSAFAEYVGDGTTEAHVLFAARVQYAASTSDEAHARKKIEKQVSYVFAQFRRTLGGSRYGDHRISQIRVSSLGEGAFEASYDFEGTFVLSEKISFLNFDLPLNPDELEKSKNLKACSNDPAHTDASLAWYYWNPNVKGCPENVEGRDYIRVPALFVRFKPTERTYPEYSRLIDQEGKIRASVFCGKDQLTGSNDIHVSKDYAAGDCNKLIGELERTGFERVRTTPASGSAPTLIEMIYRGKLAEIHVRIFYGNTRFVGSPKEFHHLLKESLENDAVVMYSGHAGVGKNLNLDLIERERRFKFRIPRDRYQIFQLLGCFTYSYYAKNLFKRKATFRDPGGTSNLDLMTNGVEGYFGDSWRAQITLIEALRFYVSQGPAPSWQIMMERFKDRATATYPTGLFNILGDEDNPRYLKR